MKKTFFLIVSFMTTTALLAAIPSGYYSIVEGKTGDGILQTLHSIIDGHNSISYGGLEPYYQQTDYTSQGYIWDMYSLCKFTMSDANGGQKSVCDCWNKEHSVPQSYFKEASPMKSDLFHVYPTDARVNNFRSNYPYGETTSTAYIDNDKNALGHIGSCSFSGYSGKIFEPDDEYKGDLARTYFYMVARYLDKNFTQSANGAVTFTYKNGRAGLTDYGVRLMLKWHRQDPVSQKEIDRNNAIYGIQHNRNPFIDYPCLVEYIWGDNKNQQLKLSDIMSSSDEGFEDTNRSGCQCAPATPSLLSPKVNTALNVGSASVGSSVSQQVLVSGSMLTSNVSCQITGKNAAMFSVSPVLLTAADVNQGTYVTVTYQPTSTGKHSAFLTLSSPDFDDRQVSLSGYSIAELVEPKDGANLIFSAYGVHATSTQTIPIRATNLSAGVSIDIESAVGRGIFSVSPSMLTAAQMNEGAELTITFSPQEIGKISTNLLISSDAEEFDDTRVELTGLCVFQASADVDVDNESVTLSWDDAGVESYLVDVYFAPQDVEFDSLILDSPMGDDAVLYNTFEDQEEENAIGLGDDGQDIGSLTYQDINLRNGGLVVVSAKTPNEQDQVQLAIYVNDNRRLVYLTEKYREYEFEIPEGASASSTVSIETVYPGDMAFVEYVKAFTVRNSNARVHVPGYPREETYLFHTITGLLPDTEYSYSITPDGQDEFIDTFYTGVEFSGLNRISSTSQSYYKTVDANGHLLLHHGNSIYNAVGLQLR